MEKLAQGMSRIANPRVTVCPEYATAVAVIIGIRQHKTAWKMKTGARAIGMVNIVWSALRILIARLAESVYRQAKQPRTVCLAEPGRFVAVVL